MFSEVSVQEEHGSWEPVGEAVPITVNTKPTETAKGEIWPSKTTLNDLLPSARPHLPEDVKPHKPAPPYTDQLPTPGTWEHFRLKPRNGDCSLSLWVLNTVPWQPAPSTHRRHTHKVRLPLREWDTECFTGMVGDLALSTSIFTLSVCDLSCVLRGKDS